MASIKVIAGWAKNAVKQLIGYQSFIPYKGFKKNDLLLFDDIFPHPISGFRYEEFKVLLHEFRKSKIIVTGSCYPFINSNKKVHLAHIQSLLALNKDLSGKLCRTKFVNINARLFYCVFLNNIFQNLKWLEKYKIPFVFTLYPGGGFQVNNKRSDEMLEKVLSSPMFKKVIVTQRYTQQYLLDKGLCTPQTIEYIFGVVTPQLSLVTSMAGKKSYLINKTTFDVCFCAAKYMARGEDKGYDVFIDFAKSITLKYDFIRFHIIGGFNQSDIDVSVLGDKISFYGFQEYEGLCSIFKGMDVIVSPNKPFVLRHGAFDGFPLGTVVEAVLNGVVAIVSDGLKQNFDFVPNEEILITESSSIAVEEKVIELISNPAHLYSLSVNGMEKFKMMYSNKMQMQPRITLLNKEII